jgi:hypothetical protein
LLRLNVPYANFVVFGGCPKVGANCDHCSDQSIVPLQRIFVCKRLSKTKRVSCWFATWWLILEKGRSVPLRHSTWHI